MLYQLSHVRVVTPATRLMTPSAACVENPSPTAVRTPNCPHTVAEGAPASVAGVPGERLRLRRRPARHRPRRRHRRPRGPRLRRLLGRRADVRGRVTCARFSDVRARRCPRPSSAVGGSRAAQLALDPRPRRRTSRRVGGSATTSRQARVYQANLCRVLATPLAARRRPLGLAPRLRRGQPRAVRRRRAHCRGPSRSSRPRPSCSSAGTATRVASAPIKGTGRRRADLLPKDDAENVMIVDLVRNDLSRVASRHVEVPGSLRASSRIPASCTSSRR